MSGAFRIYLINGIWKRYQVIITKIILALSSLAFMIMGADIMINTQFIGPLKDFIFLYVFGLISFFFQIFGKITDLDGTGKLNFKYMITK